MVLTVRLFGPMAMAVGSDHVQISVEASPPSCAWLRSELASQFPTLRNGLDQCRFAVNREYVADDAVVKATDEIALIGMVNGG